MLKRNDNKLQAADIEKTRPHLSDVHLFETGNGGFLFDVNRGTVLEIEASVAGAMRTAIKFGDTERAKTMALMSGVELPLKHKLSIPASIPVKAFSLAIAQKCNLGCTYCYAEQGTFGGSSNKMEQDVAFASVDALLKDKGPNENITLAFMGGEPLLNRDVLYSVTNYAANAAKKNNVGISFSLTTNATLIRDEDVSLFQKYNFTVTISIDGLGEVNNALRPFISGKGSFDLVKKKVRLLLETPDRSFALLARVSITPKNLNLPEIMEGLLEMGFDAVKFSPVLKSPTGKEQMQTGDFDTLLDQMIACGEKFQQGLNQGVLYPMENILSTLKRIHQYERNEYPCGAGGGYMGVSAEGELYACHRFVNDTNGHLGNLSEGVDIEKQGRWLKSRHLSVQDPCNKCWARYMCSGSCHHEVIHGGRPACDYIRGWLHYCLELYTDLMHSQPDMLRKILEFNVTKN